MSRARQLLAVLCALLALGALAAGPVVAKPVAVTTAPAAPAADPGTGAPGGAGQEKNTSGTAEDLLKGNGLISPWCASAMTPGPTTLIALRNCKSSGLQSISGSGDEIGFDTHIDTAGFLGAPDPGAAVDSTILKLVSIGWALMVLLTKAVFLGIEFALSFNPLDTSHAGSWASRLNATVGAVTQPLAMLLAPIGGVWLLWTAAIRRRHGEALKHLLLGAVLVIAATLVLANPVGTVGEAITLSQKVGLGVIGATSNAAGSSSRATAQSGLRAMGDAVIEQPLGLLEFGDTDWATNPKRLDPKLQAAAVKLARDDKTRLAKVRAARTNLRLFEAWPAGDPARNSINDEGSLLHVLCGASDDTGCKGKNKDRAEFRTGKGMWQRVIAMAVIAMGLIPFWLCLGYVAFKLIGAGLMCIIRLFQLVFMAPLAMAGRVGTERMVSWGGDFLGAIISSAVYSVYLSLVMLIWRTVSTWPGYGFVLQWLLLALSMVLLIVHRRRLWGAVSQSNSVMHSTGIRTAGWLAYSLGRSTARKGIGAAGGRAGQAAGRGGTSSTTGTTRGGLPGRRDTKPATSGQLTGAAAPPTDRQVSTAQKLRAEQGAMLRQSESAERAQRRAQIPDEELRARRSRLNGALAQLREQPVPASSRARTRARAREESLQRRAALVSGRLEQRARDRGLEKSARENPDTAKRAAASRLNAQAKLGRGHGVSSGYRGADAVSRKRRDYEGLAALAGATPAAYRAAPAAQQLRMRARVDRELAKRAEANQIVGAAKAAAARTTTSAGAAAEARTAHPDEGRSRRAARMVRPRLTARAAFRRAATADPE